jgi:hypothetical protein
MPAAPGPKVLFCSKGIMILDLGGHFLLLQGFPDLRIYDLSGSFPRDGKSFFGGWALFGGWLEVITDVDL